MSPKNQNSFTISDFSKKVIKATTIISIILLCIFLFLKGFKVILLIVAGILVATFFRGLGSLIQRKLPVGDYVGLGMGVTLFLGLAVGLVFLLSPRVSEQIDVLEVELPKAAAEAQNKLSRTTLGDLILNEFTSYQEKLQENSQKLTSFFSSFFGGLADIYIILFLGIFFMVQPMMYIEGLITLFPKPKRKRAEEVLFTIGYTLKRWLLGKMLSMLVVGVLTWVGLMLLGIPLALTLGIFAMLITFIPNFGPLISLVPAFLIALTMGNNIAIWVVVLYGVIQAIESNILTPLIQQKMIAFPLAMILIAQVILGIFTGMLGLILAVPIIAIIMVVVKMVYVEDILEDTSVEVIGEDLFVENSSEILNKENEIVAEKQ